MLIFGSTPRILHAGYVREELSRNSGKVLSCHPSLEVSLYGLKRKNDGKIVSCGILALMCCNGVEAEEREERWRPDLLRLCKREAEAAGQTIPGHFDKSLAVTSPFSPLYGHILSFEQQMRTA